MIRHNFLFRPISTRWVGSQRLVERQQQQRKASTLILLRHGQSQWNGANARFTGWCDIPLTVKGRVEAVAAGQLLRSRGFRASRVSVAFTSELQRAHETCELALASMAGHEQESWSSERIRRDWRLNERHYGSVQGKFKGDPEVLEQFGKDTVLEWRRSMHGKPPPMDASHEYYRPSPAPLTESLADCQTRALDCFHDKIAPALFDENLPIHPDERTIIVVAHSNTIRSLMAAFDKVPEELVPQIHVPNSVPILYRFERSTRTPVSNKLESAHGGSHARWLLSAENHYAVRKAIKPGGTLTRALFDAMDEDNNGYLSSEEITAGLKVVYCERTVDCAVSAVAKKIARELGDKEISFEEFERQAAAAYDGLQYDPSDFIQETFQSEPFP